MVLTLVVCRKRTGNVSLERSVDGTTGVSAVAKGPTVSFSCTFGRLSLAASRWSVARVEILKRAVPAIVSGIADVLAAGRIVFRGHWRTASTNR